jgi:hypothetical protein
MAQHPGSLGGQQTLRFATKFPGLHMPARFVYDRNLVNPKNASCLLDGEFVLLGPNSSNSWDVGTRFVNALSALDLQSVDTGGGAGAYDWSSGSSGTRLDNLVQVHFRPGQSDNQSAGAVPVVEDSEYEFFSNLIDDGATYVAGDLCAVQLIANGDLPAKVQEYTSRAVVGLLPIKELDGLEVDGGSDAGIVGKQVYCSAVVMQGKDSSGFVRFKRVNRQFTIA